MVVNVLLLSYLCATITTFSFAYASLLKTTQKCNCKVTEHPVLYLDAAGILSHMDVISSYSQHSLVLTEKKYEIYQNTSHHFNFYFLETKWTAFSSAQRTFNFLYVDSCRSLVVYARFSSLEFFICLDTKLFCQDYKYLSLSCNCHFFLLVYSLTFWCVSLILCLVLLKYYFKTP